MKYYINYEYGKHHLPIEVPENSFNAVIDEMSKEFKVTVNYSYVGIREYYITDYCGNRFVVGFIEIQ